MNYWVMGWVGVSYSSVRCWICRAELTKESPMEPHLARWTFADNIAIYILIIL
jgi:hypothetical protein